MKILLATKSSSTIKCAHVNLTLGLVITDDTIENEKVMNVININAVWYIRHIK
jgi:hypothetical protein